MQKEKITYANSKVKKYFSDYSKMQRDLPADWVRTIKKHMDRLIAPHVRLIIEPNANQDTVMICTEIEVEGVCDYHGKVVTFRVDRIVDLEILDEDIIPEPADFDMSDYAKIVIEMFDGEPQEVELLCDNELMKSVIDKFGEDIKTERVSDEQFKATLNVSTSKSFYAWCFRFARQMKILSPDKVKEEYMEMARKVLE